VLGDNPIFFSFRLPTSDEDSESYESEDCEELIPEADSLFDEGEGV